MALKSRIGTAVYEHDGNSIKLQSNLMNLQSLAKATGKDFYEFLPTCQTPLDLTKLFFHLQFGSNYTESEIYEGFFCDLNEFMTPERQNAIEEMICTLVGVDKQKLLDATASSEDDTQKNLAA